MTKTDGKTAVTYYVKNAVQLADIHTNLISTIIFNNIRTCIHSKKQEPSCR